MGFSITATVGLVSAEFRTDEPLPGPDAIHTYMRLVGDAATRTVLSIAERNADNGLVDLLDMEKLIAGELETLPRYDDGGPEEVSV